MCVLLFDVFNGFSIMLLSQNRTEKQIYAIQNNSKLAI